MHNSLLIAAFALLFAVSLLEGAQSFATSAGQGSELTDEQYAVFEAFDYLGKDWDKMISIFAENAELTICWGGEEPDCVVGGVDEVLFPFHQALREFKVGTRLLVGTKNNRVFSTQWNNYFETTLGCNEVTSGVSFWELNEEGKAVRFVSTSDDGIHCVPQYHEAMAAKEKL